MTKHSTFLRCLKNNFIKFPPTCGPIQDIEILSWKLRNPIRAQNTNIFGTVVSKLSTYGQSYDVPSKICIWASSISRHLPILLEDMTLAMIILTLMDSYLAKDKRTRGQNREAKQIVYDIISHRKRLFKAQSALPWLFHLFIYWMSGILWHR